MICPDRKSVGLLMGRHKSAPFSRTEQARLVSYSSVRMMMGAKLMRRKSAAISSQVFRLETPSTIKWYGCPVQSRTVSSLLFAVASVPPTPISRCFSVRRRSAGRFDTNVRYFIIDSSLSVISLNLRFVSDKIRGRIYKNGRAENTVLPLCRPHWQLHGWVQYVNTFTISCLN